MSIRGCKICGKLLIKRTNCLMRAYPGDYDFFACNDCNKEFLSKEI